MMQPQPTTGWFVMYIQQTNPVELQQFMAWFAAIDKDHSGTIEAREVACIQFGGRNITINTATCMLKAFDTDHSGIFVFDYYYCLCSRCKQKRTSRFDYVLGVCCAAQIHHAVADGLHGGRSRSFGTHFVERNQRRAAECRFHVVAAAHDGVDA